MKKLLPFFLVICIVAIFNMLQAQNSIDINTAGTRSLQAQESNDPVVREMFKNADRYRTFDFNAQLVYLRSNNIGDTLLLNFFDDKQYKAVIQRVTVSAEGRTVITSQIVGTEFAYCYMVVSAHTITISATLPLENEHFFASVKNGQAFLGQMRKSEMKKDEIQSTGPMVPPVEPIIGRNNKEGYFEGGTRGINDPYTIDLLFVYTPAAEQWALVNSGQTDILHLIDIVVATSNTVMANSGTGVTFNVVYKHKTNYVETNTSDDFYRFSDPSDGYMDEVHDLRNAFYADVMVFLASISYTGGTGWLLNNVNGFSDDARASCINRVQQVGWTYTVVHEIGHNMGTHHNAGQVVQPGPGLFPYSSGWKGTNSSSQRRCTVMTYESDDAYGGVSYTRIPYFSSPDIIAEGVTIGSALEDNVQTIKRTKEVTAGYRTPPTTATISANPPVVDFSNLPTNSEKLVAVSGLNLTGNMSYSLGGVNPGAFSVTGAPWDQAIGGILKVTFIGTAGQNYSAILTISGGSAANKVITISYSACSGTTLVEESFDAVTYPPACWNEEFTSSSFKWSRVVQMGNNHVNNGIAIGPHSGAGMIQFYTNSTTTQTKTALLISPKINTNNNNSVLSFWMFRDYFNPDPSYDRVNVYLSATPSITSSSSLIKSIPRYCYDEPSGTVNQWNFYTYNLSTSSMSVAYIIFEGMSDPGFGVNLYLDDIKIEVLTPELTVNPTSLTFNNVNTGTTSSPQTISVTGTNLSGNITWNKGGFDPDVFNITPNTLGTAGGTFDVTFTPTTAGDFSATLTISSAGAANKTVTLNGTGIIPFVAVTNITGVPTAAIAGTALTLTGTVAPSNATNQTIIWSVKDAGTTGASISGASFNATAAGTAVVTATITNGATETTNYTQDFNVTVTLPFVAVTNITGVPAAAVAGTALTLTGTVVPGNATNQTIVWSVKDAGTTGASISSASFNATAAGTAVVTATITNGATETTNYTQDFNVTVTLPFVAVTNITGVPAAAIAGTALTLTGTVVPGNATNQTIVWSVKDAGTTGASISGTSFSATAAGTAVVTATITNGATETTNYTQDFTITVSLPFVAVTNITGVPTTAVTGTVLALTGTVVPGNATNQTIIWSVKDAGTTGASISGASFNATAAGTAVITATITNGATETTNYTQDFNITVTLAFIPVTNITGVPTTAIAGTSLTLTGTVVPSNATNQTIVWSVFSAGTTGAIITGNTLTATAAGTVQVRATITNGTAIGTDYTRNFNITVNASPIQSNYIRLEWNTSQAMAQLGDPDGTGVFPASGTQSYRYNYANANRFYYITGDAMEDPSNIGEYLTPVMSANLTAPPSATAFTVSNVANLSSQQDFRVTSGTYHDKINSATGAPGADGVYDGFTGTMTTTTGLLVEHTAQVALNTYTDRPDVIEYFFTVTNPSNVARVFGLSWNVDTWVGRGSVGGAPDQAPFYVPGIRSFKTTEASVGFPIPAGSPAETFYGSLTPSLFEVGVNPYTNSVPEYFYGMHPDEDWSALVRTGLGIKDGITWQQAHYVAMAYYTNISQNYFYGVNNGTPQSTTNPDSGHELRWNPQVVKPGETIYLAFSYGAGTGKNFKQGIINFVDQMSPSVIQTDAGNNYYTNAPFTSETRIGNQSAANILSGTVTLKIPRAYLTVENTMLTGPNAWAKDDVASNADPNYDYYVYNVGVLNVFSSLTLNPPVHLNVIPQYLSDANISYWLIPDFTTDGNAELPDSIEKRLYIPKLNSYFITATTGANGTITPEGEITVALGSSQTFTFTPSTGYHVDSVFVDGAYNAEAVTNGFYTFTNVATNHTIRVTFVKSTYIILAIESDKVTIEPLGAITVNHGANQKFTFIPNAGYEIEELFIDGISIPDSIPGGSYTFVNVTKDHTIEVSYIISCPTEIIYQDYEYKITRLARMCWTAENMRNRFYDDGEPIPFAKGYTITGGDDGDANADIFGLLYDWYSAVRVVRTTLQQGICPDGWHIPTQDELLKLTKYSAQSLMSHDHWTPQAGGTDDHGFNALPAGTYNSATGRFIDLYGSTGFWSCDVENDLQAHCFLLHYYCDVIRNFLAPQSDGLSVRCVMNY